MAEPLNEFCEGKLGFDDGHVDVKAARCDRLGLEYPFQSSALQDTARLQQCPVSHESEVHEGNVAGTFLILRHITRTRTHAHTPVTL